MKTIVLASGNKHKVAEIGAMLDEYKVLSLSDIGFASDIDETGNTCEENAKIKTETILKFCAEKGLNYPVISDDSGLFVNALGGEPGVHSARYAEDHNDEANRQKILGGLEGKTDRSAYYECVICYGDKNGFEFFSGKTFGQITTKKIGSESFCYDCIFYSDDLEKTFGEATEEEKDSVSHRGRAVMKLKEFLDKQK